MFLRILQFVAGDLLNMQARGTLTKLLTTSRVQSDVSYSLILTELNLSVGRGSSRPDPVGAVAVGAADKLLPGPDLVLSPPLERHRRRDERSEDHERQQDAHDDEEQGQSGRGFTYDVHIRGYLHNRQTRKIAAAH